MTDQPTSICDEATRQKVKESLPGMRELVTMLSDSDPEKVRNASDELRKNFPGVDDLTLAAFCCYNVGFMMHIAASHGSLELATLGISFAEMAVDLAWEVRDDL